MGMTKEELFGTLRDKLYEIAKEHDLFNSNITVNCRALTAEEAIGITERRDYPIIDGHDVMMQAEFDGGIGQTFTNKPSIFAGKVADVFEFDLVNNDYDRAIFVAILNAITRRYGICDRSIHCKNEGPEECSKKAMVYLKETYGDVKIALIGYQPALLEGLSNNFSEVRILDLNPELIGKSRYGVTILDGDKDYKDTVLDWADLVLCTGSTVGNGSVVNFLDIGKEVLFYGTTGAGAAALMGWKRLCYAG